MKKALVPILFSMCLALPAAAHERWDNGKPIPDWVKTQCCGVADAHQINDAAIHERADGVYIDGYSYVIPYDKVMPSPDGTTWLFYRIDTKTGDPNPPICFFHGINGS